MDAAACGEGVIYGLQTSNLCRLCRMPALWSGDKAVDCVFAWVLFWFFGAVMRMWMVDPALMCRKHLLGEHVELHMLVGSIKRGKSLAGFIANCLIQPADIAMRHSVLAAEMSRRGYKHKSPLEQPELTEELMLATVSVTDSEVELFNRCPDCRAMILEGANE